MMVARSRVSFPPAHRSTATRSTVMPPSAANVACGSLTPRSTQGVGDRGGVVGQLGEFPLAQFGGGGDDSLPLAGQVLAKLAEHGCSGVESRRDGIECTVSCRCAGHPGHDPFLESGRSTEQHLSLVREVPEEGALGHSGSEGDLGSSGLVEAPLRVERESRLLQPPPTVRFPSTHDSHPTVDSH